MWGHLVTRQVDCIYDLMTNLLGCRVTDAQHCRCSQYYNYCQMYLTWCFSAEANWHSWPRSNPQAIVLLLKRSYGLNSWIAVCLEVGWSSSLLFFILDFPEGWWINGRVIIPLFFWSSSCKILISWFDRRDRDLPWWWAHEVLFGLRFIQVLERSFGGFKCPQSRSFDHRTNRRSSWCFPWNRGHSPSLLEGWATLGNRWCHCRRNRGLRSSGRWLHFLLRNQGRPLLLWVLD